MIPRITFLLDVDNTLLNNDAAKIVLAQRVQDLVGTAESERFWEIYEEIRLDTGVVNYPLTMARFDAEVNTVGSAALQRVQRFGLADIVMGFPYQDFLYPEVLPTITHLRELGHVAILSDGDPTYQPSKIARSGLGQAVAGYVLVYPHKEEHLREVTAAFPADHYVLVEDKPTVITKVRERLHAPLTTILVKQGKYATAVGVGAWPGSTYTIDAIGDLRQLTARELLNPSAPTPTPPPSIPPLPELGEAAGQSS